MEDIERLITKVLMMQNRDWRGPQEAEQKPKS